MAWENLISAIEAVITTNGNNEITGQVLRELLTNNIVPQLGLGKFQGVASPSTVPDATPQTELYYFAEEDGNYVNFGGLQLSNEFSILEYKNSAWEKTVLIRTGLFSKSTKDTLRTTLSDVQKNFFSTYNGVDSSSTLESNITLQNIGDSIEFTFSVDDLADNKGMGIIGELGQNTSHIGIYTNGQLYIRNSAGTWLTTEGFLSSLTANTITIIKLEWVSGGIRVYKDNVFQKQVNTGTVILSNIGHSYTSYFQGKVRNITIASGGQTTYIESPYFLVDGDNVSLEMSSDGYLNSAQKSTLQTAEENDSLLSTLIAVYETDPDYYTRLNGTTSEVDLGENYVLQADGDYIELTMRAYAGITNYNEGLGVFGVKGNNSNNFGFYDNDSIWYKAQGDLNYTEINGLSTITTFKKYKFQVVNGGTEYELFVDGVSAGTFTKSNDFIISNIGKAYFGTGLGAKVDIKEVVIHTATQDLDISLLYFNTLESVDLELKKDTDSVDVSTFKKAYVTFEPTGFGGNEKFIAYVQNEANPKYYFGFEICHEIDASELVYANLYRLRDCYMYEFDGTVMSNTGIRYLTAGESEFVYRTDGKADFTGGFHGDEQLTEINFYLDGVRLTDLVTPFALRECSEFSYIQKSTMHETAATGGIVNPAHPIEAIHHKYSIFSDSGFQTRNRVIWQAAVDIAICYGTLHTLGTDIGGKGQTDRYIIETFDESGGHRLDGQYKYAHVWNEANEASAYVESEFDVFDDTANQFIWDTATYNKYYRDTGPQLPSINDEWNFRSKVKFNKL
jgi:hypothetical protein